MAFFIVGEVGREKLGFKIYQKLDASKMTWWEYGEQHEPRSLDLRAPDNQMSLTSVAVRREPNAADFVSGTARAVRCCAIKLMKNRVDCATPLQELAPAVPKVAARGWRQPVHKRGKGRCF